MADDRRRKGGGEDATTVEPETLPKKEREGIVQWDDNGELTIVLDCGRYSVDPPRNCRTRRQGEAPKWSHCHSTGVAVSRRGDDWRHALRPSTDPHEGERDKLIAAL